MKAKQQHMFSFGCCRGQIVGYTLGSKTQAIGTLELETHEAWTKHEDTGVGRPPLDTLRHICFSCLGMDNLPANHGSKSRKVALAT